ncbi:GNAT family N-acetyltransferase [Paracidovorax anthurii]|uniref:Ribosomal protein S18 acetylase RimI-like enzyme n=1 Tax=Paracidovorax anthurii TaxID=78229 RepID=A0A328ZKH8_9BURK|nr:GNAT family N-acetyltransferase [Paracidovorax anthurii]RAR85152.1 ribosomal protein S18 acetylase RimI-like enzyme [Paracidovorax anthurii]
MNASPDASPPAPTVRALVPSDLPDLLAVQLACYGEGFVESGEVFARRLASPVNRSLALERGGAVHAYLAAYGSLLDKVTPLHGDFEAPPCPPDTLYLHDMAVRPDCAGQGLARALLEPMWRRGREAGLRHTALVAVQGSRGYWERRGYAVRALEDPAQRARLAGYGPQAVYMARLL